MKKSFLPVLFIWVFLVSFSASSQITGTVSSTKGDTLPFVNVYIENSNIGTTSNEEGNYELQFSKEGTHTVVFQFLGFKTLKKPVNITSFPFRLDAALEEETTSLDEVLVQSNENPANKIIRSAIKNRKKNLAKVDEYTADFYSRGIWRLKDVPEKIMGQEVGDLDGGLDSTRSGVIYLSETVSKIHYQAPDNFKERIVASKVSGNDSGFSMNTALESNSTFYQNTVKINREIVSPIADYAFNYYKYKLEGAFYDEQGNLINKISVIPKRPADKVFSGEIYIVEGTWEIFGAELATTGQATQITPIEELVFKQNFKYSEADNTYVLISQTISFEFAIFGLSGNGSFVHVYSNYDFEPESNENTFGREILYFEPEANKKDSLYWQRQRPLPLTLEEATDYIRKDSIQEVRNSPAYLDSIDRARNKFNLTDLLFGYSYQNSLKDYYLNIGSPLFGANFNTVQGWNTEVDISFRKSLDENGARYYSFFANTGYGFADERLRTYGGFLYKFNNFSKPILTFSGGIKTQQINDREPITPLVNSIATSYFKRNYLKLYDKLFAEVAYQQELFNGFRFMGNLSYENRSPLYNSTDHVIRDVEDVVYTSNNPLQPYNFGSAPFVEHNIIKLSIGGSMSFGQEYMTYPDGRFTISNNKYPKLSFKYEKGFAANISDYNFDHLSLMATQKFSPGSIGEFGYLVNAGTFFENEKMSFLDYQHFHGNQTRIGTNGNYLGVFNLLPYYALSTNSNYAEIHTEHNFDGWILGKIPLLNRLNYNLVIGAHALYSDNKPYSEYSVGLDNLGFGKFRFLRLDYVVSNFDGQRDGAFIFGLKFLDMFQ